MLASAKQKSEAEIKDKNMFHYNVFLVKKPSRPPPPKTEEKPQEPVDSGSSGEESDDDQEQVNLEVETKVSHTFVVFLIKLQ